MVGGVDDKEERMRVVEGWARVYQETEHTFDYSVFVYPTENLARQCLLEKKRPEGLIGVQRMRLEIEEVGDAKGK